MTYITTIYDYCCRNSTDFALCKGVRYTEVSGRKRPVPIYNNNHNNNSNIKMKFGREPILLFSRAREIGGGGPPSS